ncbi:hypothetical protein R3P38DRAFT_3575414 [Favolaschia claudopus]|uniref:Uncharacterized protein n=1 Tax=Favolaschia claudopus TaxID=2862362 RepID=A0AAW0APG0_9AGAR
MPLVFRYIHYTAAASIDSLLNHLLSRQKPSGPSYTRIQHIRLSQKSVVAPSPACSLPTPASPTPRLVVFSRPHLLLSSAHADRALTSLLQVACDSSFIWPIALSISINPFTSRLRADIPSIRLSSAPDALRARMEAIRMCEEAPSVRWRANGLSSDEDSLTSFLSSLLWYGWTRLLDEPMGRICGLRSTGGHSTNKSEVGGVRCTPHPRQCFHVNALLQLPSFTC